MSDRVDKSFHLWGDWSVKKNKYQKTTWEVIVKKLFLVIPVCLLLVLGACDAVGSPKLDPSLIAFVAQTQTATSWTPTPVTPSPTPVPKQAVIVNALNDVLRGADPLAEALDAKFSVTDVAFIMEGKPSVTTKVQVNVECEWIFKSSCTVERAFVVLLHVLEKDGVRKKVVEQIPQTVKALQVRALDHMNQVGVVEISWKNLLAFADGEITGDQLAARTSLINP